MKLRSARIRKFRAIRESHIRVGSELALVGQNNAGKSSVLRALNAFFNFPAERLAFEAGRHRFQKNSISEIEVNFEDVPDDCILPRVGTTGNATLQVRARLRYKKTATWQTYSNGSWAPAGSDFHDELRKHIRYIYVPLRRDHEISGWGDQGLLQSAVEAWVRHHTRNRDRISPKVAELGTMIQSRAFDGLSKHLRKVTPLGGSFSFQLEYTRPPDYALLLRDLALRVTEGAITVDLEECGSGTQSMTAFALYSYLAEVEGNAYILGIEEPEQNLHPQAQRELLRSLRTLPLQVLFTTHSTVMTDELRHDEVILCRRVSSTNRGIEVTTTQLPSDFWCSSRLDEERYYQFFRRRNSEFFFANFVILTESHIDAEVIREVLRRADADPIVHGVSILSLDGVQSLPYAFRLLRALNLSFATVLDKDYFLPYLNDELEQSRDTRGFPRYRKEYCTGTLVDEILPAASDRTNLLDLFHSNHSRAMDVLEAVNVFCFRWSLEVDLVNSVKARELLFNGLNVPASGRTTNALLVDRKKAIKKLEAVLPVVKALQPSNLPNSYKRLRKVLPDLIRKATATR